MKIQHNRCGHCRSMLREFGGLRVKIPHNRCGRCRSVLRELWLSCENSAIVAAIAVVCVARVIV